MSNTVVYYDLLELNSVKIPDVKKGTLTLNREPKYNEYEVEGGGKVIEPISKGKLKGNVSFSGLMQSEIQTIETAIDTVCTMKIYSPYTNTTREFLALIIPNESQKLLHDASANAWSYGFDFEEIGDVLND